MEGRVRRRKTHDVVDGSGFRQDLCTKKNPNWLRLPGGEGGGKKIRNSFRREWSYKLSERPTARRAQSMDAVNENSHSWLQLLRRGRNRTSLGKRGKTSQSSEGRSPGECGREQNVTFLCSKG